MAVLIYDSRGQPYAKEYYETFKTEPYGKNNASLTVTSMNPLGAWNLPGLLKAIRVLCTKDKDLLIVGHGNPHGLRLPLAAGKTKTAAQYRQLRSLIGKKTDKDKASYCMITEAEVKLILTLRTEVLKLKLLRVEIRACDIGQSMLALSALKDFLGAGTVGAPDLPDFFGKLNFGKPNNDGNYWQKWQKEHPGQQIYNMQGGKVAVQRLLQFNCLAETTKAVNEWIKAYLPTPTKQVNTQKFPVHAFLGSTFFFPNESGYVSHIKHYSKGNPLLQGDIFGGTGALKIPEVEHERRMLVRTGRQVGLLWKEAQTGGQTRSRRGPIGIT